MKIDETELQKLAEKLRAAIAPPQSYIAAPQAMRAANETESNIVIKETEHYEP
jgi:hypothetical protein